MIAGTRLHGLWRVLLVLVGAATYYGAVRLVGLGLVRWVGVPRDQKRRMRKLTMVPYFSATLLLSIAGMLNPLGMQLVWQSALPATAGADSGLLCLQYYIPRDSGPAAPQGFIHRSYAWTAAAVALVIAFVGVLGRGVTLHR